MKHTRSSIHEQFELTLHRIGQRGDEALAGRLVIAIERFDLRKDFGRDRALGAERTARRRGDEEKGDCVDRQQY